jgi:hypothetical protein
MSWKRQDLVRWPGPEVEAFVDCFVALDSALAVCRPAPMSSRLADRSSQYGPAHRGPNPESSAPCRDGCRVTVEDSR